MTVLTYKKQVKIDFFSTRKEDIFTSIEINQLTKDQFINLLPN